jgi:peptidoglycan/LPS O-acetylase OafA/YrhL
VLRVLSCSVGWGPVGLRRFSLARAIQPARGACAIERRPIAIMQLRQLTFLRFVAAAGVVVFHYGTLAPSLAWGLPYWKIANAAVSFFFFLSGFILGHVYGRRPISRRADFYVARAARIVPLYALALLAAAIFHTRQGSLDWDALALNALLVQAWVPGYSQTINAPGWSLSVEMFFYLCFPLLLPVVARARSSARLLGGMALAWVANTALHVVLFELSNPDGVFTPLDDFSMYHPLTHFATFAIGMGAARWLDLTRPRLQRWSTLLVAVGVAGIGAMPLAVPSVIRYHHNGLFVPFYFCVVVGLAAAQNTRLVRVLAWRPLEFLGEISYGLYILQEPAAWLFFALLGASGLELTLDQRFWLLSAWLVGAATFSYLLVEAPLRSVITRGYHVLRPVTLVMPDAERRALARGAENIQKPTVVRLK